MRQRIQIEPVFIPMAVVPIPITMSDTQPMDSFGRNRSQESLLSPMVVAIRYPNPTRERGAIPQVPHSRFGLGLVVFILPLALSDSSEEFL
jgi:hypothetical protein